MIASCPAESRACCRPFISLFPREFVFLKAILSFLESSSRVAKQAARLSGFALYVPAIEIFPGLT